MTERELALLGMLHVILKDQKKAMIGDFKTNGSQIEISSRVRSCIASALGADLAYDLIKGNVAANADTVLRAAKKLGKRTLRWIGAAWAAYEFAQCIR